MRFHAGTEQLGDFPELDIWGNNLYQDKIFKTRKEFNEAWDNYVTTNGGGADTLFRRGKEVVLTLEDVKNLHDCNSENEFDSDHSKLIGKLKRRIKKGIQVSFK